MNSDLKRLPLLLRWEMLLQWRYFFWLVGLVVTLVWNLLLMALTPEALTTWLPVLIFADISNIGLLFIAGSLILERQQGTLDAVAVMPVGTGTWLLSKLISLTLLTAACGLVLVVVNLNQVSWVRIVPALLVTAAFFASVGFILVCPFRNILNYFLVMAMATTVLSLPLLSYFGLVETSLFWLLPSYPIVLLLQQAFETGPFPEYLGTLAASTAWICAAHYLGVLSFHRFVAARVEG